MNARITVVGSLFLGVTTCLAPVTAHAERALAPEVEAVFAALARPLPPCAGSSARVAARPDQSRPHDCNEPIVAATVEAKGTRETVRVAARFEGWRGRYVFHCHNLEHEDMMMMANFEVV